MSALSQGSEHLDEPRIRALEEASGDERSIDAYRRLLTEAGCAGIHLAVVADPPLAVMTAHR